MEVWEIAPVRRIRYSRDGGGPKGLDGCRCMADCVLCGKPAAMQIKKPSKTKTILKEEIFNGTERRSRFDL